MTFEFRPAVREQVGLLIGIAGPTGSGKTYSALSLATGLAGGKRFAMIDTEARRALHYAETFTFDHTDFGPPFTPERYTEAIEAADVAGYPVIVVDSTSHEHAGDGGLLDWHEAELDRMAGADWKRREAMTFAAWVKPKMAHKRFVSRLLQVRAHVILCFRAEEKIDIVKGAGGKTEIVPKRTLAGHVGWIPIAEKNMPYEMTVSLLVTPDKPGFPQAIKLQEQHRAMFPPDKPIAAESGVALAQWAAGASQPRTTPRAAASEPTGDVPAGTPPGETEQPPAGSFTPPDGADTEPNRMTMDEFKERREAAGIGPDIVIDAGKELFGTRAVTSLSEEEWGALWDAIKDAAPE